MESLRPIAENVRDVPAAANSAAASPASANVEASSAARRAAEARASERNSSLPSLEALREDFRDAVSTANERLADRGAAVSVSVDKSTNTVVVQVKDRESGEMIRQIPPEAALQITRNIERLTGIVVDRKV